jgi:hypothetical protein
MTITSTSCVPECGERDSSAATIQFQQPEKQVPPLRFAPVGMTRFGLKSSVGMTRFERECAKRWKAGPSTPLRSGRDDTVRTEVLGRDHTLERECAKRRKAGPSTPLRSGRDDTSGGQPPHDLHAYAVAATSFDGSSLKRTDTSFDTPGSCIVTP